MEMKNEKPLRFYSDNVKKQRSFMPWHEKSSTGYKFSFPHFNANAISNVIDTLKFDHKPLHKHILDPGSRIVLNWNRVFIVSCLLALFVDPLYFYLPSIGGNDGSWCMKTDYNLRIIVTFFRTIADLFYMLHMVIKFRTAYVSPSSRVFGRGELVMDPKKISQRYIRSDFFIDLIATLPIPQFVNWFIMPAARKRRANHNNNALALIVLLQYIPRLYVMFPLSSQIIKATGVVTKTAWAGAAYNLLLYMLASHVLGAAWYVLSVDRLVSCWKSMCRKENSPTKCLIEYLNCDSDDSREHSLWILGTDVFRSCDPDEDISLDFGIFENLVTKRVASSKIFLLFVVGLTKPKVHLFFKEKRGKYTSIYGLLPLHELSDSAAFFITHLFHDASSYGQNLSTSTFIGETSFSILIAILGLVLFAHLIGNMETYLQSLTVRLEEWRQKRRDTEEWMRHRQLPEDLRRRVRRFDQYKWLATRGVHEEAILRVLPADLSRDIQRHLCLDLVKRVPFFSQMDDQLLDAICQRLVSSLCIKETYIVREGDPVTEMLFIIRGHLDSSTTNGGQTGFFNSITLKPSDFCGEELLAWALVPKSSVNLPASTRTVRALEEVEAFALSAEDLKLVASQFRRLHSKKLQHTFRFYSHHWRTWAACFIQAAWRRYNRRKIDQNLSRIESFASDLMTEANTEGRDHEFTPSNVKSMLGWTIPSRLAESTKIGDQRIEDVNLPKLPKPEEPDFSAEPDD